MSNNPIDKVEEMLGVSVEARLIGREFMFAENLSRVAAFIDWGVGINEGLNPARAIVIQSAPNNVEKAILRSELKHLLDFKSKLSSEIDAETLDLLKRWCEEV